MILQFPTSNKIIRIINKLNYNIKYKIHNFLFFFWNSSIHSFNINRVNYIQTVILCSSDFGSPATASLQQLCLWILWRPPLFSELLNPSISSSQNPFRSAFLPFHPLLPSTQVNNLSSSTKHKPKKSMRRTSSWLLRHRPICPRRKPPITTDPSHYSILILSATLILMSFRFSNFSDDVGKRKRAYDGLLLDAGGTLLQLAKPVEETYLTIGRKFGERLVLLVFL